VVTLAQRPDVVRAEPAASDSFASHNPANGEVVAQLPTCGVADIDAAVRTARETYERGDWSGMSPRDRAKRLHAYGDAIAGHAEELALLDSLEMGVPIASAIADLHASAEHVHATAELADKLTGDVIPNDPSALVLNVREPYGVIGAITP
jgi:acyl-CoA reductase-like NAD-dependent aldehyde dehydrogenase